MTLKTIVLTAVGICFLIGLSVLGWQALSLKYEQSEAPAESSSPSPDFGDIMATYLFCEKHPESKRCKREPSDTDKRIREMEKSEGL